MEPKEKITRRLTQKEIVAALDAADRQGALVYVLGILMVAIGNLKVDIESLAKAHVKQAREERKTTRKAIVHRHQAVHGHRAKIQTSRNILIHVDRKKSFELVWREVWFRQGDKRPKYNSIDCTTKSGTDVRHVVKGAHEDEVDLLTEHEMRARQIRQLWSKAKKLERVFFEVAGWAIACGFIQSGDDRPGLG